MWKYFLVCPIFTLPRVGSLLNSSWPWVNFGGEINFVNEYIYFQNYLHHPPPYGSWSSIVNFGSILKQKMKETEHIPKLSPDVTVGVSFMLHNPGPLDVTIQSISTLGVRTTIENGWKRCFGHPLVVIVIDVHPSLYRESSVPHPMIVVASSCLRKVFQRNSRHTWSLKVRRCHYSPRSINVKVCLVFGVHHLQPLRARCYHHLINLVREARVGGHPVKDITGTRIGRRFLRTRMRKSLNWDV